MKKIFALFPLFAIQFFLIHNTTFALPKLRFELLNVVTNKRTAIVDGATVAPSAFKYNIVAKLPVSVSSIKEVRFTSNRGKYHIEKAPEYTLFPTEVGGGKFGKPLLPGIFVVSATAISKSGAKVANGRVSFRISDALNLKIRAPGHADIELGAITTVPFNASNYNLTADVVGISPSLIQSLQFTGSKLSSKTINNIQTRSNAVGGLLPGAQTFTVILRIKPNTVFQTKTVTVIIPKNADGGSSSSSSSSSTGTPTGGGTGAAWASSFEDGYPGQSWADLDGRSYSPNGLTKSSSNDMWTTTGAVDGVTPLTGKMYKGQIFGLAKADPAHPGELLKHRPYPVIADPVKGLITGPFANSFYVYMKREDFGDLPAQSDLRWIHLATYSPKILGGGAFWETITLCVVNNKIVPSTDWEQSHYFKNGVEVGKYDFPDFPWNSWVKITTYSDYANNKFVMWVNGDKRLEGGGGAMKYSNRLEGAHWGLYTPGVFLRGIQYDDEIKIWPMPHLSSFDIEPLPPPGL